MNPSLRPHVKMLGDGLTLYFAVCIAGRRGDKKEALKDVFAFVLGYMTANGLGPDELAAAIDEAKGFEKKYSALMGGGQHN